MCFMSMKRIYIFFDNDMKRILHILPPLQNISKSESKKLDVFGSKFRPNTFSFDNQLLLIFCNG
jgi:hypothetical protein